MCGYVDMRQIENMFMYINDAICVLLVFVVVLFLLCICFLPVFLDKKE